MDRNETSTDIQMEKVARVQANQKQKNINKFTNSDASNSNFRKTLISS